MNRRWTSLLACSLLVFAAACGGDDDSDSNNDSNNGTATNNGGSSNNGDTTGATTGNNGEVEDSKFWHAEFTDSEVELPEANGQFLMITQSDSLSKITSSNNVTGAFLDSSFPSMLMEGEMTPTALKISFITEGYSCEADPELVVTIDSLDPFSGSFAGPMSCYDTDRTMEFSATVTSTMAE